jgi:hypothetical protein
MGYKFLGLIVWRVGTWYMRRHLQGARRKVAFAGVSALTGLVFAGAAAVQRRLGSNRVRH